MSNGLSILLISTPKSCSECLINSVCFGNCKLKDLPAYEDSQNGANSEIAKGWNRCIDEIIGRETYVK